MSNADQVQKLLRDHGATLAGEGLTFVVKLCEYAATGNVERIRILASNGVDVSLGDVFPNNSASISRMLRKH